jgi:hypothetical protein
MQVVAVVVVTAWELHLLAVMVAVAQVAVHQTKMDFLELLTQVAVAVADVCGWKRKLERALI